MRWKGETCDEYWKRVNEWHTWFAWYPVKLEDGDWVWLGRVERSIKPATSWCATDTKSCR